MNDFIKLNEVCIKITDGSHYSPIEDINGEYPMLSVKDMFEYGFKYDDCKFINQIDYEKLVKSDCKPKYNDVLIAKDGSYLKHVFVIKNEIEQAILSSIGILRPNLKKIVPEYLKYFLHSPFVKNEVAKKYVSGSALPRIILKNFGEIEIINKPILEQQKIANVLSFLDSKIELNNKINKELEAMAKTLYDYWFVQFDFPDENGKSYKSSGGKMVYNQELKREIPEGWEVRTISQLIGNNKGGDWGKEKEEGNYTQKVSCIRGADLNGLNGLGELNPPERFILDKNSNKILESYDLIVEISGGSPTQSTGRLSFVIDETITRFENPLICSNFCKSFSLKNPKHFYYFIYMWNNLYDNSVLFGWEGKTSGIKNLLFDSFTQKYFIVLPNESSNQKFYEKMDSLHKMKQKNLKENQELSKLRDWLLPMLMNGQVRVK